MSGHILVLNYWSLSDGLTQGATLPHIVQLVKLKEVEKVVLVTMEREPASIAASIAMEQLPDKVEHVPLYLKQRKINLFSKIGDFVSLPKKLRQIVLEEGIEAILAVGTLAGALAHLAAQKLAIPYYVAFYEPHAAYMLENEVWGSYSLRFRYQRKWEREQALAARGLILVSAAYKQHLLKQYMLPAKKICIARNAVNQTAFAFSTSDRERVRQFTSFSENATIGLYAGKYGDLYYKEEAFYIYKRCFEHFPHFRLIILSPQPKEEIEACLRQFQIDEAKVYINSVPHTEVPAYLSAADFAFATIKSYPSARYCSPVKVGEYWASGLPVLLTEGVGDDSDIIQREGGGATFNLRQERSLEQALRQIQQILKDPNHRQEIPKLAQRYRSPERIREAYEHFFGQKAEGQR